MGPTNSNRALALVAALVAVAVSAPLLRVYFTADDFEHLYQFANYGPTLAVLAAPHGGHQYLVRNPVFAFNYALFGMHAAWYFATVLVTQVVNVLLLFALVRRLTGSASLACVAAVMFAVSPANAGTLGWYSVYGHALAGTLVLCALLLLTPQADGSPPLTTPRAAAAAGCMLAASQSFATGMAAALVLPVVAPLLRPSLLRPPKGPAVILCAVPVVVVVVYRTIYAIPTRFNDPATFALIVILATSWRSVLPITGHLLVIGLVDLVLGAAYPLTRYPDAVAAGTFAVFMVAVAWALARGVPFARRGILALLTLAIACAASVAAGRAVLYIALRGPEQVLPTVAAQTRYQYLAQIALAAVLCLVLAEVGRRTSLAAGTKRLLFGGWMTWALAGAVFLLPPLHCYESERATVAALRDAMAAEIHAQPAGSTVCLPNRPAPLAGGFPGSVGVFILFERANTVDGRRVYFVTSDSGLLAQRETGGRLASLLVPAGACPPRGG